MDPIEDSVPDMDINSLLGTTTTDSKEDIPSQDDVQNLSTSEQDATENAVASEDASDETNGHVYSPASLKEIIKASFINNQQAGLTAVATNVDPATSVTIDKLTANTVTSTTVATSIAGRDWNTQEDDELKLPDEIEKQLEQMEKEKVFLRSRYRQLELMKEDVNEEARLFERNLRLTIIDLQKQLANCAKQIFDKYKAECRTKRLEALDESILKVKEHVSTISQLQQKVNMSITDDVVSNFEQWATDVKPFDMNRLNNLWKSPLCIKADLHAVSQSFESITTKCTERDPVTTEIAETLDPPNVQPGMEVQGFVSSKMKTDGSFWFLPSLPDETVRQLNLVNTYVRERYIEDLCWQNFETSSSTAVPGQRVYALSALDSKWYRGVIEDDFSYDDKLCIRMVDYGTIEYIKLDGVIPILPEYDVFDKWQPQAVLCTIYDTPQKCVAHAARWAFNSSNRDTQVQCSFVQKVEEPFVWGGTPWKVELSFFNKSSKRQESINQLVLDRASAPQRTKIARDIRLDEANENITLVEAVVRPKGEDEQLQSSRVNDERNKRMPQAGDGQQLQSNVQEPKSQGVKCDKATAEGQDSSAPQKDQQGQNVQQYDENAQLPHYLAANGQQTQTASTHTAKTEEYTNLPSHAQLSAMSSLANEMLAKHSPSNQLHATEPLRNQASPSSQTLQSGQTIEAIQFLSRHIDREESRSETQQHITQHVTVQQLSASHSAAPPQQSAISDNTNNLCTESGTPYGSMKSSTCTSPHSSTNVHSYVSPRSDQSHTQPAPLFTDSGNPNTAPQIYPNAAGLSRRGNPVPLSLDYDANPSPGSAPLVEFDPTVPPPPLHTARQSNKALPGYNSGDQSQQTSQRCSAERATPERRPHSQSPPAIGQGNDSDLLGVGRGRMLTGRSPEDYGSDNHPRTDPQIPPSFDHYSYLSARMVSPLGPGSSDPPYRPPPSQYPDIMPPQQYSAASQHSSYQPSPQQHLSTRPHITDTALHGQHHPYTNYRREEGIWAGDYPQALPQTDFHSQSNMAYKPSKNDGYPYPDSRSPDVAKSGRNLRGRNWKP